MKSHRFNLADPRIDAGLRAVLVEAVRKGDDDTADEYAQLIHDAAAR